MKQQHAKQQHAKQQHAKQQHAKTSTIPVEQHKDDDLPMKWGVR